MLHAVHRRVRRSPAEDMQELHLEGSGDRLHDADLLEDVLYDGASLAEALAPPWHDLVGSATERAQVPAVSGRKNTHTYIIIWTLTRTKTCRRIFLHTSVPACVHICTAIRMNMYV